MKSCTVRIDSFQLVSYFCMFLISMDVKDGAPSVFPLYLSTTLTKEAKYFAIISSTNKCSRSW